MTLSEMLRALWRRKFLVGASLLVGLAIAAGLILSKAHQYRSVTQVLVTSPRTAEAGTEGQATTSELILHTVTYAQLVGVPGFVQKAAADDGIPVGDATVAGATSVNTTLLSITVTSSSRANVARLAGAVVRELQKEVDSEQAGAPAGGRLHLVEVQAPTNVALSRNIGLTLGVALASALAVGATLGILLEAP